MAINRKFFFSYIKSELFGGAFNQPQVDGLTAILDKWEQETPEADDRWLAYMLATAHHETGTRMQPVRETYATTDAQGIERLERAWIKGVLTWVKKPYWRKDAEGKTWLGRGLVQITHRANYDRVGTAIGADLVTDPNAALLMPTALAIMFDGMRDGLFTGHKLVDFFNATREDWRSARKIINGLESADKVAGHARKYYAAIGYTTGP